MSGKIGRPRTNTSPIMLRVDQELLARIDELRRAAPDLPSRPEVVRRLVEKALQAGADATPVKTTP